jgi:predicted GNAT family acetyltransferase
MKNWKVQQKDSKEQEKERRKKNVEYAKALSKEHRKYLSYRQTLKLNAMIYTKTPEEIRKLAEDWIMENKKKEGKI